MNFTTPAENSLTSQTKRVENPPTKQHAENSQINSTLKIVAYARASPGSPNPEPQLQEIRGWAKSQGHEVVAEFVDNQASGKDFERGAWRKAKEAVKSVDAIVCTKLDRFGRSVRHIHEELWWLKQQGKGLVTVDGTVNTVGKSTGLGGAIQDLTLNIFAAIAEFERAMILDRTRTGRERARLKGVKFGRKPRIKDDEQVAALFKQGWSETRLSKKFGCSRSAVHAALVRGGVF